MGRRWQFEKKRDYYYKSAKRQRYRSRASYKLLQLDKKFHIIKKGDRVLDLGAAPGGWSQVALEKVGEDGLVVAVDLNPIKPFKVGNFHSIKGDFRDEKIQGEIYKRLEGKADVILSDASPSLSGIKDIDQLKSIELAENVVKIAEKMLKKDGNILIKVFQGPGFKKFLKRLKRRFRRVKSTKPPSSRKGSAEMYIIGTKFKGS